MDSPVLSGCLLDAMTCPASGERPDRSGVEEAQGSRVTGHPPAARPVLGSFRHCRGQASQTACVPPPSRVRPRTDRWAGDAWASLAPPASPPFPRA